MNEKDFMIMFEDGFVGISFNEDETEVDIGFFRHNRSEIYLRKEEGSYRQIVVVGEEAIYDDTKRQEMLKAKELDE